MKKSRYNLIYQDKEQGILFNSLNSTCVLLTLDELTRYLQGTYTLTEEETYAKMGFIIPDDYNEIDAVMYLSRKATEKDRKQFYRIYTTLACNAQCPYCYEKGSKPQCMTHGVADSVCDFILEHAIPHEPIIIEWFGGEPLLNYPIIDHISTRVTDYCKKNEIGYFSRMVSNGLLFSDSIISKAKSLWMLSHVQITLDGTKDNYERIKGFQAKDAFNRVLSNIDKLLESEINVTVRLNYNDDNTEDLRILLNSLANRFSENKHFRIYARRIMGKEKDNSFIASEDNDIMFFKEIVKCGFVDDILDTLPRRDNICLAHLLCGYIVLPNGELAKCSQAAADMDIVGDVYSGVSEQKIVRWCSPRLPSKCLECILLPLCNGGCLYERFQNKCFCFASEKMVKAKLAIALEQAKASTSVPSDMSLA